MKFFEMGGGYSYYALIAAETLKEAKELYKSEVGELDDCDEIKEISEIKARVKHLTGIIEDGVEDIGFDETVKRAPSILLIDGGL